MKALAVAALLVVLVPPAWGAVQVPVVLGQTEQAATVSITGVGLVVDITYGDGEAGIVSAQLPAGGELVEEGSTVALTVGKDNRAQEDGEALYRVVLNHVLTMFWVGILVGMFVKLTNRS